MTDRSEQPPSPDPDRSDRPVEGLEESLGADAASTGRGRRWRQRASFGEDFRRFFVRGLAALLPTLITISVIVWAWNFLWDSIGRHVIWVIKWTWVKLAEVGLADFQPAHYIARYWDDNHFRTRLVGVLLAIVLVYIVGLFVGNLIGRTVWKIGEVLVMKIPVIRAIYPAVKQVTDFVLSDRKAQFASSRVVAVHARDPNVWSIGLVTGEGLKPLSEGVGQEMVTVFVPSSPTAFSGYVVVVPRDTVVELPLKVEEAMRLLVSGGVIGPNAEHGVPRSFREVRPPAEAQSPREGQSPGEGKSGAEPVQTWEPGGQPTAPAKAQPAR